MRVGDRVRIGRGAWLYGDLGAAMTLGLEGTVSRGPERRWWGVGVNVRLNADELRERGGRWWTSSTPVEMTFNADGVEAILE